MPMKNKLKQTKKMINMQQQQQQQHIQDMYRQIHKLLTGFTGKFHFVSSVLK